MEGDIQTTNQSSEVAVDDPTPVFSGAGNMGSAGEFGGVNVYGLEPGGASCDDFSSSGVRKKQWSLRDVNTRDNNDLLRTCRNSVGELVSLLLNVSDMLHRFSSPAIRAAFLSGKICSRYSDDLLRSLDILRRSLGEFEPGDSSRGNTLTAIMLDVPGEPSTTDGISLPFPMSNREWAVYLKNLLRSSYWHKNNVKASEVPSLGHKAFREKNSKFSDEAKTFSKKSRRMRRNRVSSASSEETPAARISGKYNSSRIEESNSDSSFPSMNFSPRRGQPEVERDSLVEALRSLGRPKDIVPPSEFDGTGPESMSLFLDDYERYFQQRYAGTDRQCAKHLRQFLAGAPKKMYDAIDGAHRRYSDVKSKLLEWDASQHFDKVERLEEKWEKTYMEHDETLTIYALRLERMAHKLFKKKRDCDRKLIRKFGKTVPVTFREVLQRHERDLPASGISLDWDYVKRLASGHDRTRALSLPEAHDEYDLSREIFFSRPEVAAKKSQEQITSKASNVVFKPSKGLDTTSSSFGRQTYHNRGDGIHDRRPRRRYVCDWCGKTGHTEDRCWAKVGACLICGSSGHKKEMCPRYEAPRIDNFVPTCSLCGGSHLGQDCSAKELNC